MDKVESEEDLINSLTKIEIPLKPAAGAAQKQLPSNVRTTLQNEYAVKYLEIIGATPTKENIDFVLTNLPIKDALVIPAWVRETLVIIPDRINESDVNITQHVYNTDMIQQKPKVKERKLNFLGKGVSLPEPRANNGQRFEVDSSSPKRDLSIPKLAPRYIKPRRITRNTVDIFKAFDAHINRKNLPEFTTNRFKKLLRPLEVDDEELLKFTSCFNLTISEYIPQFKEVEMEPLRNQIIKFLESPLCTRFFGLLTHFVYWNVIHPFARRAVTVASAMVSTNNVSMNLFPNTPLLEKQSSVDSKSSKLMQRFSPTSQYNADQQSDGASTVCGGMSVSSETSLSMNEKETLYVQLEECMGQLKIQVRLYC